MSEFQDFFHQVKRANDIVDVISSYIEVRQRGSGYVARCPFHGEKTPSFHIHRGMQIFKCFGCGESGDVIKFVEKYESCSRFEALEILARRANIPIPQTASQRQDKDFEQRKKQRELHLKILRETAVYYYKCYYSKAGEKARHYFEGRGFDVATAKKFGIGYSPNMFGLVNYLKQKGFTEEDCVKCGVLQRTRNNSVIDTLADRLIVPIFNMQGKVIAFGGRALDAKTMEFGKYKNTPESSMFTKRDNLFSIHIAKEQKQLFGQNPKHQSAEFRLVVVEGYMDVIAMYQAGFKSVVASMGTSLTVSQARWLSRLTDTVYICYDGDSAGQKATVRGMDILDEAGLEVRVMHVPDNMDPDEYIKEKGATAFEKLIDEALPLPEYKLKLLEQSFPINSADPAIRNNAMPKYVKGAIVMLKQLDETRRAHYISVISAKTGYSNDYFTRKLARKDDEEVVDAPTEESAITPQLKAKYFVASCLLHGEEYATLEEMPTALTPFLQDLYDYLFSCKDKGETPQVDMLYTVCPDATQEEYNQIVGVDLSAKRLDKNAQYFAECKKVILVEKLQMQKEKLLVDIKQNPYDTSLLQQLAEISAKITNC